MKTLIILSTCLLLCVCCVANGENSMEECIWVGNIAHLEMGGEQPLTEGLSTTVVLSSDCNASAELDLFDEDVWGSPPSLLKESCNTGYSHDIKSLMNGYRLSKDVRPRTSYYLITFEFAGTIFST